MIFKLRSVLGQRNDGDRPPYDPYLSDKHDLQEDDDSANDNVVTLPRNSGSKKSNGSGDRQEDNPVFTEIDRIANKRTKLNRALRSIVERDPTFEPQSFLSGAKLAYEMIVNAFADGDKKTLKSLLSRDVYHGFADAIDGRAAQGEKIKSSFVGIEKADIKTADLQKDETQITVRFISQIISATLDEEENVIDGDLQDVVEVVDMWTFSRSIKSRDPNWKLAATEAGD